MINIFYSIIILITIASSTFIFVRCGSSAQITTQKSDRIPQFKKILVYTGNKWDTRYMINQIKKRTSQYEVDGTWSDRMAFNNDELLIKFLENSQGDVLLRLNKIYNNSHGWARYEPTLEYLKTGEIIWRAIIQCGGTINYTRLILNQLKKDGVITQ